MRSDSTWLQISDFCFYFENLTISTLNMHNFIRIFILNGITQNLLWWRWFIYAINFMKTKIKFANNGFGCVYTFQSPPSRTARPQLNAHSHTSYFCGAVNVRTRAFSIICFVLLLVTITTDVCLPGIRLCVWSVRRPTRAPHFEHTLDILFISI